MSAQENTPAAPLKVALFATIKVAGVKTGQNDLVRTGEIPHFMDPPPVLFWGTRVFLYQPGLEKQAYPDHLVYEESWSFTLTTT